MSLILLIRQFHTNQINLMAGHSKWANIRHIKALKDGQRAAIFTKLTRQIRLAIQEGGSSNPSINTNLRNTIDNALRKNMPMSTIQNAIKKFESNKVLIKKYLLEIRILNKIFLICVLYTDNLAGFKMQLAPILKKSGALYTPNQHLFEDNGIIEVKINDNLDKNKLEQICTDDAIECGAEDIEIIDMENGIVNFHCNPIELTHISRLLSGKGYTVENAEHIFIPKTYVTVSEDEIKLYEIFYSKLKNFDGIEEIYDNLQPNLLP